MKDSIENIVKYEAPTYINTTRIFALDNVDFYMWDVIKSALSARVNIGLAGRAGMGKSQLFADVQALFGNNASCVRGRNDLDIKSLYRVLNFKGLTEAMEKGGTISQKELSDITKDIYRPLVVVEEINRCVEIVQNQLFSIFEGFIEMDDGKKYSLGGTELKTFKDLDGTEFTKNVAYSVGVWTANLGNGQYTGTVSIDKGLRERSHLIIDVDNFNPGDDNNEDLDKIYINSGAEIRLKEQENPEERTKDFIDAFNYLKQESYSPNPQELCEELIMFRYLIKGLNYIPCEAAKNKKTSMKNWPSKAEEDNIGNTDDEKIMYRMVYPASVRSAQTIMAFARAARNYTKAKNPKSNPEVLDSVIESFKLIAPYSGIIDNPQRIREDFVDNEYLAACKAGYILKEKIKDKKKLIEAIVYFKSENKPLPKTILDQCKGEYECFK